MFFITENRKKRVRHLGNECDDKLHVFLVYIDRAYMA